MAYLTRLERLLFRLEAQHACLTWAFREIENLPGIVFEMGLGHGRTYDHLRTRLPAREIHVFDREIDCFPDCRPPDDRLFLGEIGDSLVMAGNRFAGQVILAHADMGSYEDSDNLAMRTLLGRLLPAVLAPGAIVLSDLPLELSGARQLPCPAGAREDSYFVYRNG
jgi:hypothetical protein